MCCVGLLWKSPLTERLKRFENNNKRNHNHNKTIPPPITPTTTTTNLTLVVLGLGAHDLNHLQPGRYKHSPVLWGSIVTAKIVAAASVAATVGATVAIAGFVSVCPPQQKRGQLASKRQQHEKKFGKLTICQNDIAAGSKKRSTSAFRPIFCLHEHALPYIFRPPPFTVACLLLSCGHCRTALGLGIGKFPAKFNIRLYAPNGEPDGFVC